MNDDRGPWYLLTGLVIGVILGLVYSLKIDPVVYEKHGSPHSSKRGSQRPIPGVDRRGVHRQRESGRGPGAPQSAGGTEYRPHGGRSGAARPGRKSPRGGSPRPGIAGGRPGPGGAPLPPRLLRPNRSPSAATTQALTATPPPLTEHAGARHRNLGRPPPPSVTASPTSILRTPNPTITPLPTRTPTPTRARLSSSRIAARSATPTSASR